MADAEIAPLSGSVPKRRYHEGKGGTLVRADSTRDESDPQLFSATDTIKFDDVRGLTLKDAFERMKTTITEIYDQRERLLIETVKKAAESVGNEFDAGGRELSPELIVEMLEKIEIGFDDDGRPLLPTIIMAPEAFEKLEQKLSQADDESVQAKMEALIERKRKEWHARESHRKLVD